MLTMSLSFPNCFNRAEVANFFLEKISTRCWSLVLWFPKLSNLGKWISILHWLKSFGILCIKVKDKMETLRAAVKVKREFHTMSRFQEINKERGNKQCTNLPLTSSKIVQNYSELRLFYHRKTRKYLSNYCNVWNVVHLCFDI